MTTSASRAREAFWKMLWGDEAYPLSQWTGVDCPITPSRFDEAFERFDALLAVERAETRLAEAKWWIDLVPHHSLGKPCDCPANEACPRGRERIAELESELAQSGKAKVAVNE